jgi:hypothetical protein
MQTGRGTLTWAYVFFWCGALSVLLGGWRVARSGAVPASRLVPGGIMAALVFAAYVAAWLRMVRRLPGLSPPAAQQGFLLLAGVGLILASMLLNLQ